MPITDMIFSDGDMLAIDRFSVQFFYDSLCSRIRFNFYQAVMFRGLDPLVMKDLNLYFLDNSFSDKKASF